MASNSEIEISPFDRLHEALNSCDVDVITRAIDETVAPDVNMNTPLPIQAEGAEALKQVFTILLEAYPDLHITVDDVITDGTKTVYRNTVTGTHLGKYMGIAPTGNSVVYREIFIVRAEAGRIVETWGIVDIASQLRQLGVLPS